MNYHSPGPWSLRKRSARLPGEKDLHVVALDVLSRESRVIGSATIRPDLPAEENARVMAAAPALLAAAREAQRFLRGEGDYRDADAIVEALRDAIALASPLARDGDKP
jgi:hypothetical protein